MILDDIVISTKKRAEKSKRNLPLSNMQIVKNANPFAFEKSLNNDKLNFICEIKKASPSKGIIDEVFPYMKIAKEYEKAGADAISVLTETDFFMGNTKYLKDIRQIVSIPILQKDFIIDEYQIYEASLIGADAILLICSLLNLEQLKKFIKIANSCGISSLVETHNDNEILMALNAGAKIIGINNRNLKTFEVDLQNTIRLRKLVPEDILFVSESGIKSSEDIKMLSNAKVNAVLIGETLMKSNDKIRALNNLRGYDYD